MNVHTYMQLLDNLTVSYFDISTNNDTRGGCSVKSTHFWHVVVNIGTLTSHDFMNEQNITLHAGILEKITLLLSLSLIAYIEMKVNAGKSHAFTFIN